jgi:hypothetical protein
MVTLFTVVRTTSVAGGVTTAEAASSRRSSVRNHGLTAGKDTRNTRKYFGEFTIPSVFSGIVRDPSIYA